MTLGWKLKMSSLVLRSTMLRRTRLFLAESEKTLREELVAHIRAANFKGGEALGDADMLMCELEDIADTDDEVRDILSSPSDFSELEDDAAVLLAWSTREWVKLKLLSRLLG